jgi:hypothetical protein
MESVADKVDEPFGRQPQPVTVVFSGHPYDVEYWMREFMRRAEFKDDQAVLQGPDRFTIYPRAVND